MSGKTLDVKTGRRPLRTALVAALTILGVVAGPLLHSAPASASIPSGGTFTVDTPVVAEGDTGFTTMTFSVTWTPPGGCACNESTNFVLRAGTAVAIEDYADTQSPAPAGGGPSPNPAAADWFSATGSPAVTKTVVVKLVGDTVREPDEHFFLEVHTPVAGTLLATGMGTITNDDGDPVPSLSVSDFAVPEGSSGTQDVNFVVTLDPVSTRFVDFDYTTVDGSAHEGADYEKKSGHIQMAPGNNSVVIPVNIVGDTALETSETFSLIIEDLTTTPKSETSVRNASIAKGTGVGTLTNDDTTVRAVAQSDFANWEEQAYTCDANQDNATPAQAFVTGPATPPLGGGSIELTADANDTTQLIRTKNYDGLQLSAITGIKYSTYVQTAGKQPPYLRLSVDEDGDPTTTGDIQYLNFEPANGNKSTDGTTGPSAGMWQTWDTFATGNSYRTVFGGGSYDLVSIQAYKALHPNAEIYFNGFGGGLSLIHGCGGSGTVNTKANVDAVVVSASTRVTSYDFDPVGSLAFSAPTYTVGEGAGTATITVNRTGGRGGAVSVKYASSGGSATANSDYGPVDGILSWDSGDLTPKTFTIPILQDGLIENTETVGLALREPTGGVDLPATTKTASLSITDDDTAGSGGGGGGGIILPRTDGGTDQGYSLVGGDGSLYAFGTASNLGDMRGKPLNKPIVGIQYTPGGKGYWLVASDGGAFAFGNAGFFGSMGDQKLNSPIIGMAATPTGKGYWLFAGDGGIFSFGDALFFGSMGDQKLNSPVINMEPLASGNGYWLVAGDGGIFSFGKALFWGSMGDKKVNQPVFDMTSTDTDLGYWLVARDGGIFSFGDAEAKFYGSAVNAFPAPGRVIGMDATPDSLGYWIADASGKVYIFGDATHLGDRYLQTNPAAMVAFAAVPA